MRSTAQVGEIALSIGGDVSVLEFGNKLTLERLSVVSEELERIGLADVAAHHSFFSCHEFIHFLFYLLEIGTGYSVLTRVDVIVEPVFNSRTYTELNALIKFLQSLGQQVRRSVPEGVLAFGVVPLEEAYFAIVVDGTVYVPLLIIILSGKYHSRQPFADTLSNLNRGNTTLELLHVSVRKFYVYHFCLFTFCTHDSEPHVIFSL